MKSKKIRKEVNNNFSLKMRYASCGHNECKSTQFQRFLILILLFKRQKNTTSSECDRNDARNNLKIASAEKIIQIEKRRTP